MSLTHVDPHVSEIVMVWIQSGDLLMVWIQISHIGTSMIRIFSKIFLKTLSIYDCEEGIASCIDTITVYGYKVFLAFCKF
jgi:hypothetical protein